MSIVVPTWTLVLPIYVALIVGLLLAIRYVDARWVTPWIDRKLAKRWGVSVEEIHAAREELHRRGEW
jgi:hypothetical protein